MQAIPTVANAAVTQLLRGTLGWQGLLMCDADAITQQVLERHTQPNLTAAAAAGKKRGATCGYTFSKRHSFRAFLMF